VATVAPNLSIVFLITTLASIGLPMLNNFVGEYLVLQGTAQASFTWTAFAAVGVILSACYMLWLYQRAFYGKASESVSHHIYDLTPREWIAIIPLIVLMVWMGTFTQSFIPSISAQNARILEDSSKPKVEHVRNHPMVEVSRAR
jgi:NADH-quinone oxidoreductase subunit M